MEIDKPQLLAMLGALPLHERMAKLRSLYKLTQAGLAEIAGVTRTTATSWEAVRAGHAPGKIARNRLGTYFDLPAYVFTGDWGVRNGVRKPRLKKYKPPVPKGTSITMPEPEFRPTKQIV